MEWLQANWLWVLLGLGVVWLLLRGGGCGMGGHGSHRSEQRRDTVGDSRAEQGALDAAGPDDGHRRDEEMATPRGQHRRGGCC
jgi:hypothetical protein